VLNSKSVLADQAYLSTLFKCLALLCDNLLYYKGPVEEPIIIIVQSVHKKIVILQETYYLIHIHSLRVVYHLDKLYEHDH